MRTRLSKNPLPRRFADSLEGAADALLVGTLKVLPRSRLRMAVLVFKNGKTMRKFARDGLHLTDICRNTGAFVHDPFKMVERPDGSELVEVDPRYFAVMCLRTDTLTREIVIHESVHAGFAFARRVPSLRHWPKGNDEESVCYPVGIVAHSVLQWLEKNAIHLH